MTKTGPKTRRQTKPAHAGAAKAPKAEPGANAAATQAPSGPEVVIQDGQRKIRNPAGHLISEAQFQEMVRPPTQPPALPIHAATPARERLRKMIDSMEAVIEAEPSGTGRRRKIDPIILREVVDRMEGGADRPDPMPHVGALTPIVVAVSVELGAEWIARGKALGWTLEDAEYWAVASVPHWMGRFHPEQAAKVADHPDAILTAIRTWLRGEGRPAKGDYQGTKWDALANLCKVAGVSAPEPKAFKKAWQRSERK